MADPVTTLTSDEVAAIKSSWSAVYDKKKESGVTLFVKLFTENPSFKSQFGYMSGVADGDMKTLPALENHGVKVMDRINEWMGNLTNGAELVKQLKHLGTTHIALKVTEDNFNAMDSVLMYTLQEQGGSAFTPAAKAAWQKAWGVMKSVIVGALKG
ncbi:neuroglobin-like protein isoform X1 [Saccoglossus kowalevskii]|uniref:Neuroglobin-like protein n=1 Tax=Saccoglossus kowalevskii TaxID=10224 RepID=D1LX80_SACKO|nr:neuroglobin-like protein [Saccoglossus kowalevskii]XP_006819320.1 PREDICTED: neuroglobin-like protein isoform X1 [Saccoglossus kowalevskii]ACY92586.1 neuroglobin-like protein [Saccoglossus kowalevskii]